MEHKLSGGALSVNSRRDNAHRRDPPVPIVASSMVLSISSCRALKVGVQGSGNPGGGRSHQGLDTSCRAPSSRRQRTNRFFGGSGSGPSRGAFPFSSAENRRIGAIAARRSSGEDEGEEK